MNIDEFLALVQTRRSVRRFKPDIVPPELLEKVLEAGRWAMSGANAQPWEFVVVQDAAVRAKIVDSWLAPNHEAYVIEQMRVPEVRHHHLRSPLTTPSFQEAPVFVVVVGDRRTYQATVLGANFLVTEGAADAIYLKNMANATQMLHLAAAAAGLASEWVSVNRPWGQALKRILNIPEILEVQTLAIIGYPAYQPQPSYRRPLADITHYDKYERSKYRSGEDIYKYLVSLRQNTEPPYKQG
ncbi:MAG: nitroreductase family protein, partial [Dehalococcoidia bacterium]|nr:nitroreductase family protein [Dehalococcoidia bacterium]